MTPLYTEEEFSKSNSKGLLALKCENCGESFLSLKKNIQSTINESKKNKSKFCSKKCFYFSKEKKVAVPCGLCKSLVLKDQYELKKSKSGFVFCNSSCAAKYSNSHKTSGMKRSKLELWIEQRLKEKYSNFKYQFNETGAINSELDIYIPEIKLAFELNGIFHYEPVFGSDKLSYIKNNDKIKAEACSANNITLCIVDTSKQVRFTEKSSILYWNIIEDVIEKHLCCLKNKKDTLNEYGCNNFDSWRSW